MPDEPAPTAVTDAGLDDLERRLAAFESATKRLNRTMAKTATPRPEPAPAPAAKPGTRRLADDESSASRLRLQQQEISGLRPAVAAQGPQTGALTARNRTGGGETPGFTSKFGKPAIPVMPAAMSQPTDRTSARHARPRPRWHWVLVGAAAALVLGLLALPRLFPVLPDAAVWAELRTVMTIAAGKVEAVPVRVGDQVSAGQVLARVGSTDVTSPIDGTVARLLASPGTRLAVGETVAEVALPETRRIVVALPGSLDVAVGERVRIALLGENRSIDGNVELVLAAGAPGPWTSNGPAPRRAVLQPAPSPLPLGLGQGARVTIIGATPGRHLLHALREMLPW